MSITLLVPILERIAAALEERNAHERREARRSRRSMKKQAAMLEQMTGSVTERAARSAEEAAAFEAKMEEGRKLHEAKMAGIIAASDDNRARLEATMQGFDDATKKIAADALPTGVLPFLPRKPS